MQSRSVRILSLVMILMIVLALIPAAAFATESEAEGTSVYVAKNTATGEQYTNISEALRQAQAGETVALLQDVPSVSVVTILEDTTLDLNGHSLTARYVSSFGQLADNSETNTGLLVVSDKAFLIREKNAQIPVRTSEGYRFVEVLGFNEAVLNNGTKYVFQPLPEIRSHELLLAGQESTGVTINVRVSWTQTNGRRSQTFEYNDAQVAKFLNSYDPSTGKYGQMFALNLNNTEGFADLFFEATVNSTTGVELAVSDVPDDSVGDVVTDGNNQITQDVTLSNEQASALVSTGTLVEEGATKVVLTTTELDSTGSDVTLEDGEQMVSVDVHVAGISADNTVPVIVTLNELTLNGLNKGNIALYHVENGVTVEMTRVYSLAELDAHNEYYYDIATGTITVALSSFSEIAVVVDAENAWNGDYDTTWYNTTDEEFEIFNADQLAGFGQIVGGMAKDFDLDTFAGKTVKLLADINLGDAEENNVESKIFYPIGYYNTEGTYERTGNAITSSVSSFEGTFDGNGHTIANFYQNTWEMKGDDPYYAASEQYYNDAMGLFGYVVNGVVKNLTVDHFSSDGEFTPTGVIAAYAENATFENISITNCNPRVYNTGNGGIIGIGGRTDDTSGQKLILKNITVDSTNKISALWGSWDVACSGLVGMFRGNAAPGNGSIHFENCHVAAEIDVFNDVCANYQYYQYRYAGMLIGSVRHNETVGGKIVPVTNGITAKDTTVLIGNWKNDYYCELVSNSIASYTHDYQFSRLDHITSIDEIWDGTNWTKAGNFILVNENGIAVTKNGETICYHIVKDGDTFKQHFHKDSGEETVDVNGDGVKETVLRENNQRIYLPFPEQLFTGYSWGVSHIALESFEGVEVSTVGKSCDKFESVATGEYSSDTTLSISDLFKSVDAPAVSIRDTNVQVFVSPANEKSTVTGTYVANISDWTQGTLTLSGEGAATITITDYYFCNPTTITVTVSTQQPVVKFQPVITDMAIVEGTKLTMGDLFRDLEELNNRPIQSSNVKVTVAPGEGSTVAGAVAEVENWKDITVTFNGTGKATLTITDNDFCAPTEIKLTVVSAADLDSNAYYCIKGHTLAAHAGAEKDCPHPCLVWTEWTSDNSLPTDSGNYYLTKAVTLAKQAEIRAGKSTVIDLKGNDITATNRAFLVIGGAELTIIDSSTDEISNQGEVKTLMTAMTDQIAGGGVIYVHRNSRLNIYGGQYNGSALETAPGIEEAGNNPTTNVSRYGGTVLYINPGSAVNIEGGSMVGGISWRGGTIYNAGDLTIGGNAVINGGYTYNMGATIFNTSDAKAMVCGNAIINSGISESGTDGIIGGTITVTENATLNSFSMNVRNDAAQDTNDGEPADPSQDEIRRSVMALNILTKNVTISGNATINGQILIPATENYYRSTLTIAGTPKFNIPGVEEGHPALFFVGWGLESEIDPDNRAQEDIVKLQRNLLDLSGLKEGTTGLTVRLPDDDRTGVFGIAPTDPNAEVKSNTEGYLVIVNSDNKLEMIELTCGLGHNVHDHNATGNSCKLPLLQWTEWNKTDILPTSEGNYRLTQNVNLSTQAAYNNVVVSIDLNGKTVTVKESSRIMLIGNENSATVNLYDSKGTGGMKYTHADPGVDSQKARISGSIAYIHQYGTLNAYNVTMDVSAITVGEAGQAGNALCLGNPSSVVNLYRCHVIGSQLTAVAGNAIVSKGNLYLEDTFIDTNIGVSETPSGKLTLVGNVVMDHGSVRPYVLRIQSDIVIDCTKLTAAGPLLVRGNAGTFIFATPADTSKIQTVDGFELQVSSADSRQVKLVEKTCLHGHNIDDLYKCNCKETELKPWINWTETTSLPTTTGYWRLTENVNLIKQAEITSGEVHIDLNGKTVTAGQDSATRLMLVGNTNADAIVNLYNGSLTYVNQSPDNGGSIIYIQKNGTLNAYNVVMDAKNINGFYTGNENTTCSALFMAENATAMNLYNCTVTGSKSKGRTLCMSGGDLRLEGTIVYGGVRVGENVSSSALTLKGDVQLLANGYTYGLYVTKAEPVDCKQLGAGAKLEVYLAGDYTFATADAATNAVNNKIIAPMSGYTATASGITVTVAKSSTSTTS